MRRALVQTDRSIDPRAWTRAHEAGERPDVLPYGLDRLAEHGFQVEHRKPLSPRAGVPARILRGVGHRWDWWGAPTVARRSDVDVNLCWDERSGIPTGLFAQRNSPALATGVIWLTDERRTRSASHMVAQKALARCSRVWALSSAQLPVLNRAFGVPDARLSRLPFGIDASFWAPRHPIDVVLAQPARVVAVGNDRDRDHDTVLRALAPLARADLVGLDLVTGQALDVPPDIGTRHATMSHLRLRDMYAAADVVAVALRPNLHVSGMTTVLEGQAMGRPVVCTRTPGMSDYVIDGVTGFLVPPGDAEAMRNAVSLLVQDPDRAAEMGRKGREFVTRSATTTTQAAALADILHDI